jgi:Ser/Thr protein kinase RdoA (MazF antagonist)
MGLELLLQEVLRLFGLQLCGAVPTCNVKGTVNLTFTVETDRGWKVVQRLAPMFDEQLVAQGLKVHYWLRGRNVMTPEYCLTRDGRVAIRHGEDVWRVCEYIAHDPTASKSPARIIAAAHTLGKFHTAMVGYPHAPVCALPHFHDSRYYFQELMRALKSNAGRAIPEALDLGMSVIEQGLRCLGAIPASQIVIHGDPKFDNFLFAGNAVAAIVDLDTVMMGNELLDLGDALRSWCRTSDNAFKADLFQAAYASYCQEHHVLYAEEQVLQAVELITLELLSRYLVDAVDQSYFRWNEAEFPSLQEQNLHNARQLYAYYRSIADCRVSV